MGFTKTSTYIQYQGSEESAGSGRSHSDTLPTSDYSGSLRSYIPANTKFSKVIVYMRWGISRSSADGKITIGGNQVASGSGSSTRTNMTSGDVKSYFQSGTNNSGLANSEIKFSASVDSILGANCYWCWYIQWYPIWKLTVNGGTGSGEYNMGSTATIEATVPTGYKFVKWSDGDTSAKRTVTVSANATYTAQFEKLTYTVTATGENGTVTGGGTYEFDSSVTLTAIPNSDYKFVKWSDGNIDNPRTVKVKTSGNDYVAIFELDKINKIYIGTTQPKEIYVGTTLVKAIYVGTTKIYG